MSTPKFDHIAQAKVLDIHDGDTMTVAILMKKTRMKNQDVGYHVHVEDGWITLHTAIRMYGINAPEMSVPAGTVARDYLRSQVPLGSFITLKTSLNPADKYGRWLGIILKDNISLNDLMVSSGNAIVYLI